MHPERFGGRFQTGAERKGDSRVQSVFAELVPFVAWMRNYRGRHMRADLVAGLTVAVVAVPQSMAYALIAGVPVQYGLYASIIPTIVACLWGSSAQLITGPTTAVSLVVFTTLAELAQPGTSHYLQLAFLLALVVGAIQIGMGLARLGVFLNFVSHSVILGFSAGAAVLIGFKQIPSFLGLKPAPGSSFLGSLLDMASHLHAAHLTTLGLGVLTIVVIIALKKLRPAWPGTLIAMVAAGALVAGFDLNAQGVAVVGAIPQSLPPFHIPWLDRRPTRAAWFPAPWRSPFWGWSRLYRLPRPLPARPASGSNMNQEFIGQGISNLSAGFFSGYPGSGSFIRSAVNFRSGAKTPMSGIISGVAVAVTVLLAAPLAASLPVAALAGVLLVVAVGMIRFEGHPTHHPLHPQRRRRAGHHLPVHPFSQHRVCRLRGGPAFDRAAHGDHLPPADLLDRAGLQDRPDGRGRPRPHVLPDGHRPHRRVHLLRLLRFRSGGPAAALEEPPRAVQHAHPHAPGQQLRRQRRAGAGAHRGGSPRQGRGPLFSGVNARVFQVFKNSGLLKEVGETHFRSTTGSAIRQAMRESFCPFICAQCEFAVFVECRELKLGNWEVLGKGLRPRCGRKAINPAS